MKVNRAILIALMTTIAVGCEETENFDFGEKATGEFEAVPFEFNSTIYQFIPSADVPDEVLVAWDFGYSDAPELIDRSIERSPLMQFPAPGVYVVTMILTTDAGITAVKKEVVVDAPEEDALPLEYFLITSFDNPQGKTWIVDRENDGHSGAGRNNSQTPNIWSRPAGSLECLGLYNDEYTFLPDLSFVYETGGDIYTRSGFQGSFSNAVFQSAVCDNTLGLSGNDMKADYTAPEGLTWSVSKDEAGRAILRLSEGGYIGMGVAQTSYELQVLTSEEMYLRFLDGNGSVSWYKRLVPKP